MTALVTASRGPLGIELVTNLRDFSEPERTALYDVLGEHLGIATCGHEHDDAGEPLHKAAGEPPDPRYPELQQIIRAAQRNWDKWGDELIEAVASLVAKKRLPLSPIVQLQLQELLATHRVRFAAIFSGKWPGKTHLPKDVLLFQKEIGTSPTEAAFHLGRVRQVFEVHLPPDKPKPLGEMVKAAIERPMTKNEERALDYVQRRSFQYMRRPGWGAGEAIGGDLLDQEYSSLRNALQGSIRRGESRVEIRHRLEEALQGHPTLKNDLDRVVRTETHFAHSFGAYVSLKEGAAKSGEDDPEVYKLVSPRACAACRRIWGTAETPKRYRLSQIEAWEAAGGNFRKPAKEWQAVIGPVHPNCTEGPLQYYSKEMVEAIDRAIDAFLKKQEQERDST